MPNYTWKCETCEIEVDIMRKVADIEIPPTTDELMIPEGNPCRAHEWKRLLNAKAFKWYDHGSDGGRFHNKEWGAHKEISKLQVESANSHKQSEKDTIQKEIKKVKKNTGLV